MVKKTWADMVVSEREGVTYGNPKQICVLRDGASRYLRLGGSKLYIWVLSEVFCFKGRKANGDESDGKQLDCRNWVVTIRWQKLGGKKLDGENLESSNKILCWLI